MPTQTDPTLVPWTARQTLVWTALPLCIFAAFSLACGGTPEPGGSNSLTPEDARTILDANDRLQGQWTVSQVFSAMDDVGRPVTVAEATWTLEIFATELLSGGNDPLIRWSGALTAEGFCVVNEANFVSGALTCEAFDPIRLGRCSNHECEFFTERLVTGLYTPGEDTIRIEDQNRAGHLAFLDKEVGYINFDTSVASTMTFDGDDRAAADVCDSNCTWRTSAKGLFEDEFRNFDSNTRTLSIDRRSDARRAGNDIDETPEAVRIDTQEDIDALLLGPWDVSMRLQRDLGDEEGLVQRAQIIYGLDIFEVTELGSLPGGWQIKGGARPRFLCASTSLGQACDIFEGPRTGLCSSSSNSCPEDNAEIPVNGLYNSFENTIRLDNTDAEVHALDGSGFISIDVNLNLPPSFLLSDGTGPVECDGGCNWRLNANGPTQDNYEDSDGNDITVELERQ